MLDGLGMLAKMLRPHSEKQLGLLEKRNRNKVKKTNKKHNQQKTESKLIGVQMCDLSVCDIGSDVQEGLPIALKFVKFQGVRR